MYRIGSLLLAFLFFVASPQAMAAKKTNLQPIYSLLIGGGGLVITDPDSYQLTVHYAGNGSGTVTPDSGVYAKDTEITLTASADTGSDFLGWSGGGCSGTGDCTVTMDAAVTVTAEFTLQTRDLDVTVNDAGEPLNTVTSSEGGISCGTDCDESYNYGTVVTLTANPKLGYSFTWSGACTGTGECVVAMTEATSVTATFATEDPIFIAISKSGDGSGHVASDITGLDCGTGCTKQVQYGQVVNLTATADPGSAFQGWIDGGCTGTGTCTVTVTETMTIDAPFNAMPDATLTVSLNGTGNGTVTSNPVGIDSEVADYEETYPYGTVVTLTATAAGDGSSFSRWTGGGCDFAQTCQVTMDQAVNVTATFNAFVPGPVDLTILRTGTGIVTGDIGDNDGISCGSNCSETYEAGTTVTLSASEGFIRWDGTDGQCDTDPTCHLTVGTDKVVTAIFAQLPIVVESELNNDKDSADEAQLDAVIQGKLSSLNDQDWFKIPTAPKTTVTVRFNVNVFDPAERWRIQLFRGDNDEQLGGVTVTGNDTFNIPLPFANLDYYFVVLADESVVFSPGANYELTLLSVDNIDADTMEHEPNDAYNSWGTLQFPLTLGTPVSGSLMTIDDQDMYKVNVDTDKTVTVAFDATSRLYANGDWVVTVYHTLEGLSYPDLNNPIARIALTGDSEFQLSLLANSSPYYFVVERNPDIPNANGGTLPVWNGETYSLTVSDYGGATVAEQEFNDTDANATPVGAYTGDMSFTGQLLDENDVDWFSFTVGAGQTVTVDVTFNTVGVGTGWKIFLYKGGALDTPLNTGDWAPTYGFEGQTFSGDLNTTGTYYFKILTDLADFNIDDYSSAAYTISVSDQP